MTIARRGLDSLNQLHDGRDAGVEVPGPSKSCVILAMVHAACAAAFGRLAKSFPQGLKPPQFCVCHRHAKPLPFQSHSRLQSKPCVAAAERAVAACFVTIRHTRARKSGLRRLRHPPASRVAVGGAQTVHTRARSRRPKRATISSGDTTLPLDFRHLGAVANHHALREECSTARRSLSRPGRITLSRSANRSGAGWRAPRRRCTGRWETSSARPLS